jgi:hypothetical protein
MPGYPVDTRSDAGPKPTENGRKPTASKQQGENKMPRTVKHAKLDSRTARADTKKLKRGRQPHWQELQPRVHIGYQRWKGNVAGRWLLRRYLGGGNKYRIMPLGIWL